MIKTQDKGRGASMPPFNQPFENSDPSLSLFFQGQIHFLRWLISIKMTIETRF
jgi:hypothetical protein